MSLVTAAMLCDSEAAAQLQRQRRLAGADRAADADAQWTMLRTVLGGIVTHERNNLVYCVSCFIWARMANHGDALDQSSSRSPSFIANCTAGPYRATRRRQSEEQLALRSAPSEAPSPAPSPDSRQSQTDSR